MESTSFILDPKNRKTCTSALNLLDQSPPRFKFLLTTPSAQQELSCLNSRGGDRVGRHSQCQTSHHLSVDKSGNTHHEARAETSAAGVANPGFLKSEPGSSVYSPVESSTITEQPHRHHPNTTPTRRSSSTNHSSRRSFLHSEMSENLKKVSKYKIRLQICLFLTLVSLPGNLYVFYCHQTAASKSNDTNSLDEDFSLDTFNLTHQTNEGDDASQYQCYEVMADWEYTLQRIRFWIEGVLLSAIGGVGFIGEFSFLSFM